MNQSELNKEQIALNAKEIRFNRMLIFLSAVAIMLVILAVQYQTRHSMHDCEQRLYEKLTDRSMEHDFFILVKKDDK